MAKHVVIIDPEMYSTVKKQVLLNGFHHVDINVAINYNNYAFIAFDCHNEVSGCE